MENKKDRHKILQDLSAELTVGFLEDTFEFSGKQWTMRTLNDAEEVWSDKFIAGGSLVATMSSRRAIKIAVSIRNVDGIPIEQLFFFEKTEAGKSEQDFVEANPMRLRFWYAEKMYEFLSEQPTQFIADLYIKYVELSNRQITVMKEVLEKNSLRRTPMPKSSSTSLQEKVSS